MCKPINSAYFSSGGFRGEGGSFFGINGDNHPAYDTDAIFHEFSHAVVADMVDAYEGDALSTLTKALPIIS